MGFIKDKMRAFAEVNPEIAAERTVVRARAKILGRAVKSVTELFTDDDLRRVAETVRGALGAETSIVVPCGKGCADVERVPDHRARLEASKLVMAYVDGTPIQRQMVIHGDFRDLDDEKKSVLMGLPSMQEALEELDDESAVIEIDSQSEIC
jgi:hypothetical protein